jgi:hypothetical protein
MTWHGPIVAGLRGEASHDDAVLRGLTLWRLRVYLVAFATGIAIHVAAHGGIYGTVICTVAVAAAAYGCWRRNHGGWLRWGVCVALAYTLSVPLFDQAIVHGVPLAAVVDRSSVWTQLFVALIGSRLLHHEYRDAFSRFWDRPETMGPPVGFQSIGAAIALGAFLTLLFYAAVSHFFAEPGRGSSGFVVAAVLGGTFVHIAIVFLFFVIVAALADAALLHLSDRQVLAAFRRLMAEADASGRSRSARYIIDRKLVSDRHSRAARLLAAAIDSATPAVAASLEYLAFDEFHHASRRFVRGLLPLLPLLGFLGTVIGLATAISGLPTGFDAAGSSFDVSASLSGLAVKFETTFLGLVANMSCALALHTLEKQEAEFAAECLLIVVPIGETPERWRRQDPG